MAISNPRLIHKTGWFFLFLLVGILTRMSIDWLLQHNGYFFGKPWDTFTRIDLAWQWAQNPYFAPGDYYWTPLQFWMIGSAYRFIQPFLNGSLLIVPVLINHLFFIGSLAITIVVSMQMGGKWSGLIASLLAATFAGDIWNTFSGLSEPITVFFQLCISLVFLNWMITRSHAFWHLLVLGVLAFLSAATHLNGWFLCIAMGFIILGMLWQAWRNQAKTSPGLVAGSLIFIVLAALFPAIWLFLNYAIFGNPLHFVQVASDYQINYAGQQHWLSRLTSPFTVTWLYSPFIIPVGLTGVVQVYKQRKEWLAFLLPSTLHFMLLVITTLFALSAPQQEPRYTAVYAWVLIPYAGYFLNSLIAQPRYFSKVVGLGLTAILIITGIWQSLQFHNSFNPNLKSVGSSVAQVLSANAELNRVIIESPGFEETTIIPVLAEQPQIFMHLSASEFQERIKAIRDKNDKTVMVTTLWVISSNETFQEVKQYIDILESKFGYKFALLKK